MNFIQQEAMCSLYMCGINVGDYLCYCYFMTISAQFRKFKLTDWFITVFCFRPSIQLFSHVFILVLKLFYSPRQTHMN